MTRSEKTVFRYRGEYERASYPLDRLSACNYSQCVRHGKASEQKSVGSIRQYSVTWLRSTAKYESASLTAVYIPYWAIIQG